PYTIAYDINNVGQIVGTGAQGPFLYADGVFTFVSLPGAATGINDIGQLVGSFNDGAGTHGFVGTNGLLRTIDVPGNQGSTIANDINNAGHVVGFFADIRGYHGFLDTNGVLTRIDFPGIDGTQAYGINDAGQIVGCSLTFNCNGPGGHGFLDTNGVFTAFEFPG